MLDINFIRDNKDLVKEAAEKKGIKLDLNKLITTDDERRALITDVEEMRQEQNTVSDKIARTTDETERKKYIDEMREHKELLQKKEEKLKEVMGEWRELMLLVPNVPDMSVPYGESEDDNQEVTTWGEKPHFRFDFKDHTELMTALGMVDLERGTKVHGFRGYFLKADGALLSWAVWQHAQQFFLKKNFTPVIAPSVVRKEYFYGTGHLPSEAEDLFKTQDDDYLSGTAEVPMMAYHADEILKKEELPKRYLAFSPCFRREAGSHGKDTKGLIRVHEFFKIEQLVLCEASHDESVKYHEEINRSFEEFLESLGLPYRRLLICTGDLSAGKVKQYDTEVWMPSEANYRELSSASYYHDFQTRRFNTRYEESDGKKRFVHSLNSTAVATPRILAAIVENNQQEDGSIIIPEALQKYMDKAVIEKKN